MNLKNVLFCFLMVLFSCNKVENDLLLSNAAENDTLEQRASGGTEAGIAAYYSSQVTLGRDYHAWMFSLIRPSDWNSLSAADKNAILNFSDAQFALLAVAYEILVNDNFPPNYYGSSVQNLTLNKSSKKGGPITYFVPPSDKVHDCVGAALGIPIIYDLINLNGLNGAAASKSAVKILKAIGKRYVGFVGLAWMIWDFYDCMNH